MGEITLWEWIRHVYAYILGKKKEKIKLDHRYAIEN